MRQLAQSVAPSTATRAPLAAKPTRLDAASALPARFIDFSTLRIQPKLEVSTPGDADEREADEVADRVMRMPVTGAGLPGLRPTGAVKVQRACAACEGEEKGKKLRRVAGHPVASGAVASNAAHQIDAVRGGQPLAATERAFFEPRFGMDFSQVRIHTNATADTAARSVGALAYTRGQDVVFRQGAYQPETDSGRRLVAHELAHVVQQGASIRRTPEHIQRQASGPPPPPTVYMCSKSLDRAPLGKHAFFRVGGTGPGHTTYSLQPEDRGQDCWQGQPYVNSPSDFSAVGVCQATVISPTALAAEHASYPVGRYCTRGPNSNTYVGHIARRLGIADPDPDGWTPGIDDSPPAAGTYAPNRELTLVFGCSEKPCGARRSFTPQRLPGGGFLREDGIVVQGMGPKI